MSNDAQEWRERTETRLVNLTNTEIVQNDRLDDCEERLGDIDETLRGNHSHGYAGVIQQLDEIERKLNMLRAIMEPDALGNGGVKNRLSAVEHWREDLEKDAGYRWKFWTSMGVAIITMLGLLLTNLDKIADGFKKLAPNSPVFSEETKPKRIKRKAVKPWIQDSDTP